MKNYPIIFLILSLLFSVACNAPKNCTYTHEFPQELHDPVIHLTSGSPVLYQAAFNIYKYHFSGLIAFRKMPDTEEIRIAFLSELGVKLMEFSFENGSMKNTYSIEPLKKRTTMNFVQDLLLLLIRDPHCKSVCLHDINDKNHYFCKLKKGYLAVDMSENHRKQVEIQTGRKKKATGIYSKNETPDTITVNMKLNSQIRLKKVNNAFR